MQENVNNQPYNEEQEIDIMEMISKLWKRRSMIIKWCIAGAIVGLVAGFSIPKTYTASVTLAPELQQRTNNSVSSIAAMMGFNINSSVDAISAEMFPDVVHSTPFIVDLFDVPVTFNRKDSTITTSLLDYMMNYQKSPWWSPVLKFPFKVLGWCIDLVTPDDKPIEESDKENALNPYNLPAKERSVAKSLASRILVSVDKKTYKTHMSLTMQDPLVVATVMNAVTENLRKYMTGYRTSKARQDVVNLEKIYAQRKAEYYKAQQAYANYIDSNKNVILKSAEAERERLQQEKNLAYQVYSQIATQLEGARVQTEQAKPVFAIINPVTVPLKKTAPSKAKLLLVFTFLAGCVAAGWILFGEDFLNKIKDNF